MISKSKCWVGGKKLLHWELHSCWLPGHYWAAYGKAQSKNEHPFLCSKKAIENGSNCISHLSSPGWRIEEEKFSWTPNSQILLSLIIRARKLSELQSPLHWHSALCKLILLTYSVLKICRWSKSNQNNSASTNTNFSFSSQVFANNFFLQGLWNRTKRNYSRANSIFILFYLHFPALMLSTSFNRKPVKREACIHADISGVISHLCHSCEDLPWIWIRLFTLSKIWKIWGRGGLNF